MTTEQVYYDWCYGPIDAVDRQRSDDVGTDEADAWACVSCIESGRIYQPPDSWEGQPSDWPVKDISDQLKLAEANVEVVLADVQRTTDLRPRVTVDAYRSVARIAYANGWTTPSVRATSNPEALIETAEYLKDLVVEDEGWTPWPLCPVHEIGGVEAEAHDGAVVWWCSFGNHLVAPVGQLGLANA